MSIIIGEHNLKYGLMLAPMAGVTDETFRLLCKRHGAEYTVSEMVCAKALCYEQRTKKNSDAGASAALAHVSAEQMPLAVQLFGSEPEFLAEAAKMIEERSYKGCCSDVPPAAIDINMGCPVRKITANGEGSALMKNQPLAASIVDAVVRAVKLPVTVKIRAGWDKNSVNAPEFAKALEAAGASLICVHARTKEQLYSPGIDLSVIEKVRNSVSIPVVGNGDIYTADDALSMISRTGCDGVMVGRGAQGNPWIFEEIQSKMEGKEFIPPTIEERFSTAICQLEDTVRRKGERVGIAEAKKHMAWYTMGLRNSAVARAEIMVATSKEQIKEIFQRLAESEEDI